MPKSTDKNHVHPLPPLMKKSHRGSSEDTPEQEKSAFPCDSSAGIQDACNSSSFWRSLKDSNKKLIFLCKWIGVVDVLCAVLAVIDIETSRFRPPRWWENVLRSVLALLSIFSIYLIQRLHFTHFRVKAMARGAEVSLLALLRSPRALSLIFEILLHLAQLPPFVQFDIVIKPFPTKRSSTHSPAVRKQNIIISCSVLNIFVLWRLYSMARVAEARSWLSKTSTKFLQMLAGVKSSFTLWVKSVAHLQPFYLISAIFVPIWFVIVYSYYTVEQGPEGSAANLASAFYVVAITMATVGYGDVVPSSYIGRFLCIASAFVGVITLSLTIAYINERLLLSEKEIGLVNAILKKETRGGLRQAAARVVTCSLRILLLNKRGLVLLARRQEVRLFEALREFKAKKFGLHHISESVAKEALLVKLRDKVDELNEAVTNDTERLGRAVKVSERRLRALRASVVKHSDEFEKIAVAQAHAAREAAGANQVQEVENRVAAFKQSTAGGLEAVIRIIQRRVPHENGAKKNLGSAGANIINS